MKALHSLLFAASLTVVAPFSASAKNMKFCTQAEFEAAVECINSGEEMHIKLARRTFWLKKQIKGKHRSLSMVGMLLFLATQSDLICILP